MGSWTGTSQSSIRRRANQGTRMKADNIDEVVDNLANIVSDALRDGGRVGYFASLYRQVTVAIRDAIRANEFDDGERMSRFDAAFGNRYFDALDAWRRDQTGPRCWREAFRLLEEPNTIVVQHLLLGVNAHINLDLAVAAAETSPGDSIQRLERDFFLINDILVSVLAQIQEALSQISPFMWLLDEFGGRNDERILDFNIRTARREAWQNALLLARQSEAQRAETIDRLDTRANLLAVLLARPGGLSRPVVELIRSTENRDVREVITHLDGATSPRT
jgi:Family of unknown function (DUF5995)